MTKAQWNEEMSSGYYQTPDLWQNVVACSKLDADGVPGFDSKSDISQIIAGALMGSLAILGAKNTSLDELIAWSQEG